MTARWKKADCRNVAACLAAAVCLLGLAGATWADVINSSPTEDADIFSGGTTLEIRNKGGYWTWKVLHAGHWEYDPPAGRNAVVVFELPDLGAMSNPFQDATFGVYLFGWNRTVPIVIDLYGLDRRAGAEVLTSDFYVGEWGDSGTGLHQAFLENGDPNEQYYTTSGGVGDGASTLADYLNAQYAEGAGAGEHVFLRFSPTTSVNGAQCAELVCGGAEENKPYIEYTIIPEPVTLLLASGPAAAVLLRRRRRA